jgi:hypothetical protein
MTGIGTDIVDALTPQRGVHMMDRHLAESIRLDRQDHAFAVAAIAAAAIRRQDVRRRSEH